MVIRVRHAEPSDYPPIVRVLDEWWGRRPMVAMLPRLFFVHFRPTSFVAEEDGELRGFLVGFRSQTRPEQAYVHFIGVDPRARGRGIGRRLYERFGEVARAMGCTEVLAVTSPTNAESVAFHAGLGFEALAGDAEAGGVPYARDYDGPGEHRVRFRRDL